MDTTPEMLAELAEIAEMERQFNLKQDAFIEKHLKGLGEIKTKTEVFELMHKLRLSLPKGGTVDAPDLPSTINVKFILAVRAILIKEGELLS
jgi:hypothetical protein